MSTTAPPRGPALPETIAAPTTLGQAIASMHRSSMNMEEAARRLQRIAELHFQCPEMRIVTINPQNNGQYQVSDPSGWAAKSIGVLNPGKAPVFIGVGGVSARPNSGAPSCPGTGAVTLPVEAADLEFGCDPAVLGSGTAVIYVFRYVTVQPLTLTWWQ